MRSFIDHKKRIALIILLLIVVISGVCLASDALDDDAAKPTPSPTPVPTAPPVENWEFIMDVQLGYDGLIVMNRWMPVTITVKNIGPDFDGDIGVNVFYSTTGYDRYETPFTLANGATKTIQIPIKPMIRQDMYAIELVSEQKTIAEKRVRPTRMVPPETVCVGILSDDPSRLSYFSQRNNGFLTLRGEAWVTVALDAASFPESSDLMQAFSLLVVDGFDVSILSTLQREALTDWLLRGGAVIVSGGAKAALGYPFFERWTGVSASVIKEVEDITPKLTEHIAFLGQPLDEKMWINPIPPEKSLLSAGDDGLIAFASANDGLVVLAAFDIGGKAFAGWPTATAFWPLMLRQSVPNFYAKILDTKSDYDYDGTDYQLTELIDNAEIPNAENGVPVLLILVAYVLLCGIGGYFLLKKIDKSVWMWAFTPACAILFALALLLMSDLATTNLPVALSLSRITADGQATQVTTYVSVATPHAGELTVQTDQTRLPTVLSEYSDGYYYYYDSDDDNDVFFRPLRMKQRYRYGDFPSIGFASNDAWYPRIIEISHGVWDGSAVIGNLWVGKDGVHGEVTNQTDVVLKGCAVITTFGYDSLGELLPGQRAEFSLLPPEEPIPFGELESYHYEPGVLYTLAYDESAADPYAYRYYLSSPSEFIWELLYGDHNERTYDSGFSMQRGLVYLFEQQFSLYQNTMNSFFFGYSDQLGQVAVSINGEPVERTSHQSVVGYQLQFEPIGPTGIVLYPQGYILPEIVVDMGEEKPRLPSRDEETEADYYAYDTYSDYIQYSSPVSLLFTIPDMDRITIETLTMAALHYDSVPNFYLFNHQTEEWDQQKTLSIALTGEECLPYIDEEGALYVRYTPTEFAERYDSMRKPLLSLKGHVK